MREEGFLCLRLEASEGIMFWGCALALTYLSRSQRLINLDSYNLYRSRIYIYIHVNCQPLGTAIYCMFRANVFRDC